MHNKTMFVSISDYFVMFRHIQILNGFSFFVNFATN